MAIGSNRYTEVWKSRPVRMSDELYERIKIQAKREKRTIAGYIREVLDNDLENNGLWKEKNETC